MRKAEEFATVKKSYLDKRKNTRNTRNEASKASLQGVKQKTAPLPTSRTKVLGKLPCEKPTEKRAGSSKTLPNIDSIPNEILHKIFGYLSPKSLLSCASTCKKWECIASDSILWKQLYMQYISFGSEPPSPLEVWQRYWKRRFFTDAKKARNKRFLKKKKALLPHVGITNLSREFIQLGIKFQVVIKLENGNIFSIIEQNRGCFTSSTSLQWHSLNASPKLSLVKSLEVYSLTPILFRNDGKVVKNSPRQKSLVLAESLDWKKMCNDMISSDDLIEAYATNMGLLVAVWKGTDDIAFVCASLHNYMLLEKCLLSTSDQTYHVPHTVKPDDVSPLYGLQGYKFDIGVVTGDDEISWDLLIHSDDMSLSRNSDTVTYTRVFSSVIHAFDDFFMKWKTDVFGGELKNTAYLTMTATDANNDVMWYFSRAVKCRDLKCESVKIDAESDHGLELFGADDIGKVKLLFRRMHLGEDKFLSPESLTVVMDLKFINSWFGTNH